MSGSNFVDKTHFSPSKARMLMSNSPRSLNKVKGGMGRKRAPDVASNRLCLLGVTSGEIAPLAGSFGPDMRHTI